MDLKKRIKNPVFWVSFVSAVITVLGTLGVDIVPTASQDMETVIYGVFGVLAVLGVAVDPTTKGVSDKSDKK